VTPSAPGPPLLARDVPAARPPAPPPGYRLGIAATIAVTRLLATWRVEGAEHVPLTGGLIVAANHFSFVDPALLGASLPRPLTLFAKAELWRSLPIRLFCEAMGVKPLRRGEADRAAIRQALEVLSAGGAIGLFPEGTRGPERPRVLKPGKAGVAFLALHSGAPVLPVGIAGTDAIDAPSDLVSTAFRRPQLRVRIGPLLDLSGSSHAEVHRATERVMRAIADLLPPHYRGAYASSPGYTDGRTPL